MGGQCCTGDVARHRTSGAKQWKARMREMSRALRHEIRTAPNGEAMRALLDEQVTLIKSIPEEAARRVHEWALEGSQSGARSAEVAREILRSGDIAVGRAYLI